MSDVRIAVEQIVPAGQAPTNNGSLSISNTYQIRNDGLVLLRVANAGASSCTVTLIKTNGDANATVAVTNGTNKWIGPFPPAQFNNSDDDLEITLSYITSVTVAALHLG